MTQIASDRIRLEWEDLPNGGDHDYNDCVIDIIITKLASLTIQKDVVPNDSSLWDFTIDGPDAESDRTIDDLLNGIIKEVNEAARKRGVSIGMSGKEALDLM